jgi:prepilin-type N-terminal cleavage/methylation domain-containing protein
MKNNNTKQAGFTLVEIAIVLVIIGLLLGGILKGQELLNSAKVRNLADQNSTIQAAYFGFIDHYRQVPGDWCPTTNAACPNSATAAIGVTVNIGGNGNGRIDNNYTEGAAVWEQLGRANFLGGGFTPATVAPTTDVLYSGNAPANAFAGSLVLSLNVGFSGVAAARLNLHLGTNVPVSIARELDVKVDDGLPNLGILRLTKPNGGTETDFDTIFAATFATCSATAVSVPGTVVAGDGDDITDIYNIFEDAQDCAQVFLY